VKRRVFLCTPSAGTDGEFSHFFQAGVSLSDQLRLVDSIADAEVVLVDAHRTLPNEASALIPEAQESGCRVVAIDYSDDPHTLKLQNVPGINRFLKRSTVTRKLGVSTGLVNYPVTCSHIAYCVREDILAYALARWGTYSRDLDVVCSHSEELLWQHGQRARGLIAEALTHRLPKIYSAAIGHIGFRGNEGRNDVNSDYVDRMLRSKVTVTCQPDRWEGDYRLFEALACGPLVLCDHMLRPPRGLRDGEHLVFYYDAEDMLEKLVYYLENESERIQIADRGHQAAIAHHRAWHRMEQACF